MPDVGDMVIARINASYFGQPIVNTLGLQLTAAFTLWSDCAAAVLDQLDGAIGLTAGGGSVWLDQRNNNYLLQALDVVDVSPGTQPQFSFNLDGIGLTTDAGMPPNDSLCITWRSQVKGAQGRGRSYLNAQTEPNCLAGLWQTAALDNAKDIADALLASFGEEGTGSFRLVVLHRHAAGAPVVPPVANPIFSYTVHSEVRSLGRRAMGRRVHRTPTGP